MDTRTITTRSGDIAYADTAPDDRSGRVAVFLHGFATSSHLWHNVIAGLRHERRCVAIDLPAHGATPPRGDYSMTALADAVEDALDAIGLTGVDLVGNDSGGAVCQIHAARHPGRLRTLTLTNCDTQGNAPPESFQPTVDLAKSGEFAKLGPALAADPELVKAQLAVGYERPDGLTLDTVRAYMAPLVADPDRITELERFLIALGDADEDLRAAEPGLRKLDVPTLIVWGDADETFPVRWAYRLRDTIPGTTEVVEIPGAKLFFPDERPGDLIPHLRRHWAAY